MFFKESWGGVIVALISEVLSFVGIIQSVYIIMPKV